VLPGDGVADLPALVGALDEAGWSGWYDVEIFSDNGTFGNAWPDSLWDVPPETLVRSAKDAFARVWEARIRRPVDQVSPRAV
jgi:sugar phosphate isomerase/epimerase